MQPTSRKRIADVCAYSLVFLFVYTATAKLFQFNLFQFQLDSFPWIQHIATTLVWVVPVLELAAAGLLLARRARRIGFYVSLALMVLFTSYISLMLGSGKHLPCSCGGVVGWMTWRQHLVFNLVFIGVTIAGLVYSPPKIKFYET
jgi:cation transport ATPase